MKMAGKKASASQLQHNEHMVLLEVFVERIQLSNNVDPNLRAGVTSIDFQFLDNDPIPLEELTRRCVPLCAKDSLHVGKTCLFSLTPPETAKALNQFDLFIRVYKSKKCGVAVQQMVGVALIPLTTVFRDVLKIAGDKNADSSPGGTKGFRNAFPLSQLESGEVVGSIFVAIKLTCFGKYIQTDFQMNMMHKAVEYKANEAHYRLTYNKKMEPCPEICNQTQALCPTPRTCGVAFTPPPPPPPTPLPPFVEAADTKQAKSGKGGKGGKGKRDTKKDKGKGKGHKVETEAAKQEVENKENCSLVPCAIDCYNKERQATTMWNDCSSRCPNYPDSDVSYDSARQCPPHCPLYVQDQKQPCNTYEDGIHVGDTNRQIACVPTCPRNAMQTMPPPVQRGAHQPPSWNPNVEPVTMMYASEPNYAPNVPQTNFHVDMGLGGALAARVHEESVPQKIPCPVNYMAPPMINGTSQFPNMVSNITRRQPQIVDMRPGLDANTPFRFKVGDGAIEGNTVCVNPPTIVARDGTRYTEISDPKRECFLLRIGKKFEGTMGGKNNVDIHLSTPPPPTAAEVQYQNSSQQYKVTDCAPGAVYSLGPKTSANAALGNASKKANKKKKK